MMTLALCAKKLAQTRSHSPGKERDQESGNDYFKYRYYASSTGRWLSPDPSGLSYAELANPQSLNLYSYVGNDPLTHVDLLGLCWSGFTWACDLWNGVKNFGVDLKNEFRYGQWTTNTALANARSLDRSEAEGRNNGKETAGNGLNSAANKSWAKSSFCYAFSDVLASSALTNRTVGYGAGASAGAGFGVLGWYSSISIQGVADPQGNAGVAINFGAGPFVLGLGAQAGGQASLSTAKSINDLSGDAMDVSGSAGTFGLDVSHAPGGPTSGTVTVGPGVGTRMVSVGGSHTWVPLSVNCN